MKKLFFGFLFLFVLTIKSQNCSTCNINISSYDTLTYNLLPGQTLCIDTTGNFAGTISLNGGSLCNKGLFTPTTINFNAGTIDNYSNTNLPASITLNNNRVLNNKQDASLNINGMLIVNGGSFINNGILNISQNITNTSGILNNTGILNCQQITGNNTLTNTGVINTN